jgi:hypothetical protein
MAKNNEHITILGNAFKKVFEKTADSVQPVTFPEGKNTAQPLPKQSSAGQAPSEAIKGPVQRPIVKKEQFTKLFYNVTKRSAEEVRKDFYSQSASLSKKKGILEGVCSFYYGLVKSGARSQAAVMRLYEYQCLKDEFEKYFRDIKYGNTPSQKDTHTATGTQTVKHADNAPTLIQQARKMFSTRKQFRDNVAGLRMVDVVIGLDFGTSCTKVVVGTPYEQERAFLVPFKGFAHYSNLFLLPTHISSEGNYFYLPKTGGKGSFTDLKLKLIRTIASPDDERHYEHAVAYLALVFRFVRTWFINTYKTVFDDCELTWHANVGVPSATFENDDLTEVYHKAVLTAWLVSMREGDVTRKLVSEVTESLHSGNLAADQTIDLAVFPEVAAEVAGYARSEHRQEGLHLMVDVGAGTMDICGFLLNRSQGADQYPLLSSSVKLLGALQLDRTRRNAVSRSVSECHERLMSDGISPICNDLDAYIPDIECVSEQIVASQEEFTTECKTQVRLVAMHLRKSMDPHAAAWNTGLPVFLCGGGSAVPAYEKLVDDLSDWLKENTNTTGGARPIPLQKPERLEGDIEDALFHRFAVAWGLSWPSWEIGDVITNLKPVVSSGQTTGGNWWERAPDYSNDDW